jgi:diguanylate cyclase
VAQPIHYQPIYDHRGSIVRVEALGCPPDGLSSDQLARSDRRVLATACRQVAAWQAIVPGLGLSVNILPSYLDQPGYAYRTAQIVARAGLAPNLVTLELLESERFHPGDHPDPAVRRIIRGNLGILCARGFGLALDDIGSGCVAEAGEVHELIAAPRHPLSWRLGLTTLKLDRSLVQGVDYHRLAEFIELGARHGLTVIAEGVETIEQLIRLVLLRPVQLLFQGWLFAKKLSAWELEGLLVSAAA